MGKIAGTMLLGCSLLLMLRSVSVADGGDMYKLVVKGRASEYGVPLDDERFRGCDGFVVPRPSGSSVEKINGASCPRPDPFEPHAGHYPKATPKPKHHVKTGTSAQSS